MRMLLLVLMTLGATALADIREEVTHKVAGNGDVALHYVTVGSGPLIVMVHGFPDFWYSWRHQMEALKDRYTCAALDLRGYNKSDKPEGLEAYDIEVLVADVEAVIEAEGQESAIVMGHDWGGYISWWLAAFKPERVDKLIICNLPHPRGISRELANNPEQQQMSAYARLFQTENAHETLSMGMLANMVAQGDAELAAIYREAFEASDAEAMLAYYKQNYPRPPYTEDERDVPPVEAPVLQFHGLDDPALHSDGLNNTWDWLASTYTLITVPGAGHWVHHDRPDYVNAAIRDWLARH